MSLEVMSIFSLALLVFQLTVVRGQSTDGFISIDCGLPKDRTYDERVNGLPYISDSGFINTGESQTVSSEFFNTNSPESYLRSFPNGMRNCYEIKPVKQETKYLVKARFLYGNYDGKNEFPMFDLYMGVNYWETISILNLDVPLEFEILVVTVSNSLSICLVNTEHGIPFVSVIELRPLPIDLYVKASTSQSLVMLDRQNLGGNDFIRYPKDIYDRFWFTSINTSQWSVSTNPSSILISPFGEPSSVMQSMVYPDTYANLSFSYSRTSAGDCPSTGAYIILYFAELENLISRILNVWVDGDIVDKINPSYLKTSIIEKSISFTGNMTFSIVKDPTLSAQPPILNAFEVYRIIDLTCQSETRGLDVDAITEIKSFYKVKRNWNGDPCAPAAFIWEGLNCSYNGTNSPQLITSLNLSSSGLTGEIPASLANLSALQYLDLSSNSLTGEIPDSLSRLTQLKVLNLTNNGLTGSIPKELLHMSTNGQLELSTDGNPNLCTKADSCQEGSSKRNKVLIIVISCILVVVLVQVLVVSIAVWKCIGQERLKVNQTKRFTKRKLRKITTNFVEKIGKGGYGEVYRGELNGAQVAVKKLIKSKLSTSGVAGLQAEADILTKIYHKNLVKLIGYCDDDVDNFALVYEYMEGGSLHDHLSVEDKRRELTWRTRLRIAFEVAEGLKYLHKDCGSIIVHRDIKPGNILLTKELDAKIGDFGLSKMFEDDRADATHISEIVAAGTRGYLDPEYVTTKKLRDKSDVYSFGVVLMQLITGLRAYIDSDQNVHISSWVEQRLLRNEIKEMIDETIRDQYDKNSVLGFVQIARACTIKESEQRPDITKVVKDLEELCTAHGDSPPPRSERHQVDVGQEGDDVPILRPTSQRSDQG